MSGMALHSGLWCWNFGMRSVIVPPARPASAAAPVASQCSWWRSVGSPPWAAFGWDWPLSSFWEHRRPRWSSSASSSPVAWPPSVCPLAPTSSCRSYRPTWGTGRRSVPRDQEGRGRVPHRCSPLPAQTGHCRRYYYPDLETEGCGFRGTEEKLQTFPNAVALHDPLPPNSANRGKDKCWSQKGPSYCNEPPTLFWQRVCGI